jgi:P-type E1-E2 ATPase
VGAGAASRRGILVKSAAALETAGKATRVIFDKTGTLTIGRPRVTTIAVSTFPLAPGSAGGSDEAARREVLRLAAAVEAPSEHPIAKAIVRAAQERGLDVLGVSDFKAMAGSGVRGDVDGQIIEVVRDASGATTCIVRVDGRDIGSITVADEPRGDAREAIARLKAMGAQVTMLSGDRRAAAEAVGAAVGLATEDVVAEASPEEKVKFVAGRAGAKPQAAGDGAVIMVGDGINDAAALAAADLGIAMASGTNIAIESADIVIPGDRVMAVAQTIDISRQTLRTIKQNLFFAFFYNAAAIPAAALGLLGPYGPLMAAAAMGLSDVTVIGNAIRLKRRLARR